MVFETINGAYFAVPLIDIDNNIVRPFDQNLGDWVTNSYDNYPWCSVSAWNSYAKDHGLQTFSPQSEISLPSNNINEWVNFQDVSWKSYRVVTEQSLSDFVTRANAAGDSCTISTTTVGSANTKVKYVYKVGGSYGKVLCNYNGEPFVTLVEPEKAAVNNTFNYTEGNVYNGDVAYDNGVIDKSNLELSGTIILDESTNNNLSKFIDLTNATFTVVNENGVKAEQYIESLTWNEDNRSYTVNTYDYTYNVTNNYYEYNYYTYNIQYTYNNTYVTYIGSTAEYQPTTYEFYYELPDGRSSADLTEADIAGLSFQFADVVNYKKSATDTSLRALYHFDGNTNDSSYWSAQGSFEWHTGASITYMESNAFNGALYLDEKAHGFTITLPSDIGSGDFSLQWRYYQNSATTTNNMENVVSFGSFGGGPWNKTLLQWSEQYFYDGDGNQFAASRGLSVGTWQEIALVRHKGVLYTYHNGIKIGSVSTTTVFKNTINFYFGANSRAYSMIDELRVVNFAIAEGGASYTPTAVPYDTNSILILPDGVEPIADEYWVIDKTVTPYKSWDFRDGSVTVKDAVANTNTAGSYPKSTYPYKFFSPTQDAFYSSGGISMFGLYDGFAHVNASINTTFAKGTENVFYKGGLFYTIWSNYTYGNAE